MYDRYIRNAYWLDKTRIVSKRLLYSSIVSSLLASPVLPHVYTISN